MPAQSNSPDAGPDIGQKENNVTFLNAWRDALQNSEGNPDAVSLMNFVQEYVATSFNPVIAYINTYVPPELLDQYSIERIRNAAKGVMQRGDFKSYLRLYLTEKWQELDLTATDVLKELRAMAMTNVQDFCSWDSDGNLFITPSESLPREFTACIKSIERTKDGQLKITLFDKTKALDLLGKHFKLFTDTVDVHGELIEKIVMARRRATTQSITSE